MNPVTQGAWDTDEVIGTDDANEIFYYSSTEVSPLQRQVYTVRYDGTGKKRLSSEPGTHAIEFSDGFQYYTDTWSDANTPPRVTLHKSDGTLVRVLEDNAVLRWDMKSHGFARKEFITIPVEEGIELHAYLVKPPDFDSTRKYPLLISVYGGPESQEVLDGWDSRYPWQAYMAQQGFVVACIDNRGSDGRGEAFRKSTYLQLGKLETHDQIASALYLGGKPWIDENRIGVWGWSYGGYMALLCMTKGADVFKTGIAVASVTNWRFYDSIYTERFMRTPGENPAGYDDNSPISHAALLKGKLLMIHGTGDDNVHFQNSLAMADKLIKANKQFDVFYYPDKNHNITGGNTRYHLYSMITAYILENL
jgi:dipeptidyl-peptidase-4